MNVRRLSWLQDMLICPWSVECGASCSRDLQTEGLLQIALAVSSKCTDKIQKPRVKEICWFRQRKRSDEHWCRWWTLSKRKGRTCLLCCRKRPKRRWNRFKTDILKGSFRVSCGCNKGYRWGKQHWRAREFATWHARHVMFCYLCSLQQIPQFTTECMLQPRPEARIEIWSKRWSEWPCLTPSSVSDNQFAILGLQKGARAIHIAESFPTCLCFISLHEEANCDQILHLLLLGKCGHSLHSCTLILGGELRLKLGSPYELTTLPVSFLETMVRQTGLDLQRGWAQQEIQALISDNLKISAQLPSFTQMDCFGVHTNTVSNRNHLLL